MKRLVLFNGGLKSTFLAALARREGGMVLYYLVCSQQDEDRLEKVIQLATTLGLPFKHEHLICAPPLQEILLRMLFLVLHALPVAKAMQCKCIYHGLSRDDDRRIIPVIDTFTKQLGDLISLGQPAYNGKGLWLGNVEIETPLRRLDRPRIIRLGNEYQIPWELTHSCSRFSDRHCGKCQDCLRRKDAFKREGHEDPTLYRE